MADVYVRSAATGAGTGTTWTDAYTTLAAAQTGGAFVNTNTIWLADDHAESTSGAVTYTLPTTPGLRIIGANTHATQPPTDANSTPAASIQRTTTASQTFVGVGYIEAITIKVGSGSSAATLALGTTTATDLTFSNCLFSIVGTASGGRIAFGTANNSSFRSVRLTFINGCSATVAAAGHRISLGCATIHARGFILNAGTGSPSRWFIAPVNSQCYALFEGCDFDPAVSPPGAYFDLTTQASHEIVLRGTKMNNSCPITSGTNGGPRLTCDMYGAGGTDNAYYREDQHGSDQSYSVNVLAGGASDGVSVWLAGTAVTNFPATPYRARPINVWNTGTPTTLTIQYIHDVGAAGGQGSGTGNAYQNDEVWVEVLYHNGSAWALATSAPATTYTTPTDNAAGVGTGSWTTTGMTTPKSGQLSCTIAPAANTDIFATVCIGVNKIVVFDKTLTLA